MQLAYSIHFLGAFSVNNKNPSNTKNGVIVTIVLYTSVITVVKMQRNKKHRNGIKCITRLGSLQKNRQRYNRGSPRTFDPGQCVSSKALRR